MFWHASGCSFTLFVHRSRFFRYSTNAIPAHSCRNHNMYVALTAYTSRRRKHGARPSSAKMLTEIQAPSATQHWRDSLIANISLSRSKLFAATGRGVRTNVFATPGRDVRTNLFAATGRGVRTKLFATPGRGVRSNLFATPGTGFASNILSRSVCYVM